MTTPRERYAELLSLAQLYLMQEHSLSDRILSDKGAYDYFKAFAAQRQAAARTAPPQTIARPAPAAPPPQPIANTPPVPVRTAPVQPPQQKPIPLPEQQTLQEPVVLKTKEEVVDTKAQDSPPHSFRFALTPQTPAVGVPLDDLRKLASEHLPQLKLLDAVPDDALAREMSKAWEKTAVVPQAAILSFNEQGPHQLFLKHVAFAAEMMGLTAAVIPAGKIEAKKGWEEFLSSPTLKCVIGCGNGIASLTSLEKQRKESAKNGTTLLGTRPLIVLSDISFYMQEPSLKRSLWKSLRDHLSKAATAHE